MSKKTREYVMLVIVAVLGAFYGWLSLGWSDVAFFGGMAGILAALAFVGMRWVELAPDGAWRRRPET